MRRSVCINIYSWLLLRLYRLRLVHQRVRPIDALLLGLLLLLSYCLSLLGLLLLLLLGHSCRKLGLSERLLLLKSVERTLLEELSLLLLGLLRCQLLLLLLSQLLLLLLLLLLHIEWMLKIYLRLLVLHHCCGRGWTIICYGHWGNIANKRCLLLASIGWVIIV